MTDVPAIDLARLQSEINEEVRRRRASGDFPPGLERELDAVFARYAPAGTGDDFDEVITHAEITSFVHAEVPTDSRIVPLVYVKRALRKVMAWYMRFLAQEVTAFAGAITRAVKLLGRRVDTIESVTVLAGERTLAEVRERRAGPDLGPWVDVVTTAFAGATGRILHAECGAGDLLAPLAKAGAEVYGVEPVETLAMEASRLGLDVRADDALSHLRALPPATLGGIVLSGCIDALPLGEVLELTDRAVAALVPGATLVIASGGAGALDPVVVDLAPGRPLHPATWLHLLSQRGLTGAHATMTGPAPLAAVPSGTPGADVINANTERLNRALFGSGPYAVIARKP